MSITTIILHLDPIEITNLTVQHKNLLATYLHSVNMFVLDMYTEATNYAIIISNLDKDQAKIDQNLKLNF